MKISYLSFAIIPRVGGLTMNHCSLLIPQSYIFFLIIITFMPKKSLCHDLIDSVASSYLYSRCYSIILARVSASRSFPVVLTCSYQWNTVAAKPRTITLCRDRSARLTASLRCSRAFIANPLNQPRLFPRVGSSRAAHGREDLARTQCPEKQACSSVSQRLHRWRLRCSRLPQETEGTWLLASIQEGLWFKAARKVDCS